MSTQASVTRRRPDCTRNSTSRRLNSCLLIDNTATAHLPGPQNPGVCHLYLAEGCHLYIALTRFCRIAAIMEKSRLWSETGCRVLLQGNHPVRHDGEGCFLQNRTL